MKVLVAAAVALLVAATGVKAEDLEAWRWLRAGADPVAAVTTMPRECLASVDDPEAAYFIGVGRAAFRNPLLLGGQAARSGLSCQACHRNGHDHPNFHLSILSDAPGTVDVTNGVFGATRQDHIRNPVPIPSLYGRSANDSFGTVAPVPSLKTFVRRAIEEEFSGSPAPEPVLEGLVAYIGALRPGCDGAVQPVTEADLLEEALSTLTQAHEASRRDHDATADLLLSGVRVALGRLAARYPDHGHIQQRLADLSRTTNALGDQLHETQAVHAVAAQIAAMGTVLAPLRPVSLFDTTRVQRYVKEKRN